MLSVLTLTALVGLTVGQYGQTNYQYVQPSPVSYSSPLQNYFNQVQVQGQSGQGPVQYYYLQSGGLSGQVNGVQGVQRQQVVHPRQPANAGAISALPAVSAEQQARWDNAAPVVVRANNQAPPQYYYVIQGNQGVDGSLFNHHQVGHFGGAVQGVQQQGVVGGQTVYAVVANQGQGDHVVTNDHVVVNNNAHNSVSFENLRPGNVRRLEEPSSDVVDNNEDSVVNDEVNSPLAARDSFDEPLDNENNQEQPQKPNNGKTNYQQQEQTHDEQQQYQQEEEVQQVQQEPVKAPVKAPVRAVVKSPPPPVKSAPAPVKTVRVFVQPAPVKAPVRVFVQPAPVKAPVRPVVLTRFVQEPPPQVKQPQQQQYWSFGNRRVVQLQGQQQVVQNYGTKSAAPAPVKTPPVQQQQAEQQAWY